MSETAETHPLVQRLAVDRVAGPGIVDRAALQRAHDRFSQPAGAHVLSRLQRRLAPASTAAESLPLVRVDRSAESEATATTSPIGTATAPSSAPNLVGPRPSLGGASPVVGKLVARETPGIAPVSAFVMRRIDAAPGLTARAHSELSVPSPISRPAMSARVEAHGVVQRMAESRAATSNARVAEPLSVPALQNRHPERTEGSAVELQIPRVARDDSPYSPPAAAMPTVRPLPRVAATSVARASAPLLLRKPAAATSVPISSAPTVVARFPAIAAASQQLVLRMADVAATPVQSPTPASTASITTDAAASESTAVESAAGERVRVTAGDLDMDWITEQVGNRLARRLEIERERHGVRQWRQVS